MHPQDAARLEFLKQHGFCFHVEEVPYAPGKGTTLVHTFGLHKNFGHPELFLMGYPPQDAVNFMGSILIERIKAGEKFTTPTVRDDLWGDDVYAFRPLAQPSVDEHAAHGQQLVGEAFPGVQVFFSDENYLLPWDDGCDLRAARMQTALFEYIGDVPERLKSPAAKLQ